MLGCGLLCADATYDPSNGCAPQPACPFLQLNPNTYTCSHYLATDYFRLSLNPAIKYEATDCPYWAYVFGLCYGAQVDLMGYYSDGTPGQFVLEMKSTSPYI